MKFSTKNLLRLSFQGHYALWEKKGALRTPELGNT